MQELLREMVRRVRHRLCQPPRSKATATFGRYQREGDFYEGTAQTRYDLLPGLLHTPCRRRAATASEFSCLARCVDQNSVRYDAGDETVVPYLEGISAGHVTFSDDGQWVAYVSYPDNVLWRSRVDGSEKLRLTQTPMLVVQPRWSPDGKRIAFTAADARESLGESIPFQRQRRRATRTVSHRSQKPIESGMVSGWKSDHFWQDCPTRTKSQTVEDRSGIASRFRAAGFGRYVGTSLVERRQVSTGRNAGAISTLKMSRRSQTRNGRNWLRRLSVTLDLLSDGKAAFYTDQGTKAMFQDPTGRPQSGTDRRFSGTSTNQICRIGPLGRDWHLTDRCSSCATWERMRFMRWNWRSRTSVWICSVTVLEIRYGLQILAPGRRRSALTAMFERLIEQIIEGRVAPFDNEAAERAGELMAMRHQEGRPGDLRDTMIAGIVLARRATLATRNTSHFEDLDVRVVNPWTV